MSSIRAAVRSDGTPFFQLLFREWSEEKKRKVQSSLTFDDPEDAVRWQRVLDQIGPQATRKLLHAEQKLDTDVVTLRTFHKTYIASRTGLQRGTRERYQADFDNDILPFMGDLPMEALCDSDAEENSIVQRWVTQMEEDGLKPKTIANKHGLLSSSLKLAVRRRLMPWNPCEDTRLPRGHFEPVFLEPEEFDILLGLTRPRWKPTVRFLVLSCMRWSEYTALPVSAVRPDPDNEDDYVVRISRAWKAVDRGPRVMGPPKTKKGIRTINIPAEAVEGFDLTRKPNELLMCTRDGNRIWSQYFHKQCWKPMMDEFERLTGKRPRPHDLRHTGASWMINNGAELTDVQKHLGHEKITTTVDIYGHLDRRSGRRASTAMSKALVRTTLHKSA